MDMINDVIYVAGILAIGGAIALVGKKIYYKVTWELEVWRRGLKRCWRCGNRDIFIAFAYNEKHIYYARCDKCSLNGPTCDLEKDAKDEWNGVRRSKDPDAGGTTRMEMLR